MNTKMHLKTVLQFLRATEEEAHGLQQTPAEVETLLAEFAAGRLDDQRRKVICAWLRQHPDRISDVAAAVKRNRI